MTTTPAPALDRPWAWTAVVAGVAAIVSYALLITVSAGNTVAVLFTFAFGFGLTLASLGLYFLLAPGAPRFALVAAISNVLAAALLVAMILVQIAIGSTGEPAGKGLAAVYLGLDVAWDVYVSAGTFCFAWAMLLSPAFGRLLGWSGILLAAALFVLNVATFPTPPGDAGLVDLGPGVAAWYVAVSARLAWALRSEGRRSGEALA